MFVRRIDNGSQIKQFEITTNGNTAATLRTRAYDISTGTWEDWVNMYQIEKFLEIWNKTLVTQDVLDDAIENNGYKEFDRLYINNMLLKQGWISNIGTIDNVSLENCYSYLLGVKAGDIISFTGGYQYAFLTSDYDTSTDKKVSFVTDTSRITQKDASNIIIPDTCKYLWVSGQYSASTGTVNYKPTAISINGTNYALDSDKEYIIPNLPETIESIKD